MARNSTKKVEQEFNQKVKHTHRINEGQSHRMSSRPLHVELLTKAIRIYVSESSLQQRIHLSSCLCIRLPRSTSQVSRLASSHFLYSFCRVYWLFAARSLLIHCSLTSSSFAIHWLFTAHLLALHCSFTGFHLLFIAILYTHKQAARTTSAALPWRVPSALHTHSSICSDTSHSMASK